VIARLVNVRMFALDWLSAPFGGYAIQSRRRPFRDDVVRD
jgi:hypothetical protein